ncbi:hypothetical protein ACWD5F_30085 [Streptomyces sp. NPDC002499]
MALRTAEFSLRPLLDQDRNSPMLVVNGADDVIGWLDRILTATAGTGR